jgi:hypothetical protein
MPRYIDKLRVAARVAMPREAPVEGTFALDPVSERHGGPETLLERLDAPAFVVPFQRERDGAVLLLNRRDIEWVEAGRGVPADRLRPAAWRITREERVHVRLMSGRELSGLIQLELPEEYNRTSDHLNGSGDFFPLVTPQGLLLVNKQRVSVLRVFEHSPPPVALEAGGAGGVESGGD